MPMASMKLPPRENENVSEPREMSDDYGWGLCIDINDTQLKAMGYNEPLPAGSDITIIAKAKVTRTTTCDEGEGPETRMSAQITDMELKPGVPDEGQPRPNIAQTLYGGPKA
jgi:hypothetical protein